MLATLVALSLLVTLLIDGCGSKRKERKLEAFDSERWASGRNGCEGNRLEMKDDLLRMKYQMRGLDTQELVQLLGRPDATQLSDRNQKYYIYYLEPGPDCTQPAADPLSLFVRLSAVGIANEFTLRNFSSI
jgi:hypothetical protein